MKLEHVIFGILMLTTSLCFGQKDTLKDIPLWERKNWYTTDTIDFGGKKVTNRYDSLDRCILEVQWYEGLKTEIKSEYKDSTDMKILRIKTIYNEKTGKKKSSKESYYTFNDDKTIEMDAIEKTYNEKTGKEESIIIRHGKYFEDKTPIELIISKNLDGKGKPEEVTKNCYEYKDGKKIVKYYLQNKKGIFESQGTATSRD